MRQIGVGVIGVGVMGEQHVQAYVRNPLAKLVAVAEVAEARAQEISRKYGVTAYADMRKLLERDDMEAVSICTSDPLHVDPALQALAAGKHVLLEKPIATTLADADRIIVAARQAGVKFMVGHIVRFDPRYAKVKELIEGGALGELETIFARRLNLAAAQKVLKGRVSVLSFLGVHDFDIMRWMAGSEAVRVHTEAEARLLKARGYDVEDMTFTLIRFANGVIGCAEIGWILPDTHPRRADFKLEAIGTKGVASVDLLEQGLYVCTESEGFQRPSFGHSIDAEVAHFIDCVLHDESPLVSGEDGRAALEMSLAAQSSARTGEVVTLPLRG